MTIDSGKIVSAEAEIEYFRYGNGSRVLVVLPGLSIKSLMLFKTAVAGALSLFSEDFNVYVFDRRKNLPDEYTIEDMASDYIGAFDALGLKDISFYGISQGGMIALNIAILRPDLVRTMVLGSTASRISPYSRQIVSSWNELARAGDEDALITAFASKVYSKDFYERFKDIICSSSREISPDEFRRLVILTDKMEDFDVYDRLDEIKCPVLIMGGSDDAVLGVDASIEMQAKMGCEMFIFEGFGHAVYDETSDFRKKAKAFLIDH